LFSNCGRTVKKVGTLKGKEISNHRGLLASSKRLVEWGDPPSKSPDSSKSHDECKQEGSSRRNGGRKKKKLTFEKSRTQKRKDGENKGGKS